jgi:hypothetical protein
MPGQLHSPAVFSRRKSDRHAQDKTSAELQQLHISVFTAGEASRCNSTNFIWNSLNSIRGGTWGQTNGHGPLIFLLFDELSVKNRIHNISLYEPQNLEMGWLRIFHSSFVRFYSSVLIRIFVLVLSSEPRIDRDVTYRGSNMNGISYLRDITKPFRTFFRIQTKGNDRKTQNAFMSSLRAHQICRTLTTVHTALKIKSYEGIILTTLLYGCQIWCLTVKDSASFVSRYWEEYLN